MLFNKKLKRKKLIRISREFREKYYGEKNPQKKKQLIEKLLSDLETVLNRSEFQSDERFYTYGRRDFLRKELTIRLNKEDIGQNPDYLIDAYKDLDDYINGQSWIPMGLILENSNPQEILKRDAEYSNCGVICLQEKEILLEMIREFKDALDKENTETSNQDNMDFSHHSELSTIEEDVHCPYCNSTEVWKYLYGETTNDYDRNKYILGGCEIDFSKAYKCKNCKKDF